MALAAAQVQIGHDLLSMEPGFLVVYDPDMHEDLIEDFDDAATTIEDIIPAEDVVNKVFE
jgi:hypothetical protein